jgi:hypothetical protein
MNEKQKVATIRVASSRRFHHASSGPCYHITLSPTEGTSQEILTFSEMVNSARMLEIEGYQIQIEQ